MAERAGVRAAFYNAFGLRPRLEAPNLYLDTPVILHLLLPSGERPEAEELLRRVLDLDWTLTTSTYARMEALERLQESAWVRREVLRRKEWRAIREQLNRGMDREPLSSRTLHRLERTFDSLFYFLDEARAFSLVSLNDDGWNTASALAATTHISATDSIHVATALQERCHVLVASDTQLRNAASSHIRTGDPASLNAILRRLV